MKQFISTRVPDAAWLLEEVPSPPVSRMLAEYLPGLPAGEGGPLDTPDREAVETIKKGVHLRNKVAHTGHATYTPETLETILLAVRDVLWGLDSNRGLAWIEDLRTARRF